ncbi:MAG: hypothetical protein AAF203_00965, partial [Pseudomonadota bacterium]
YWTGLPLNQVVNAGDIYFQLSEMAVVWPDLGKRLSRGHKSYLKLAERVLIYTRSQLKKQKSGSLSWLYMETGRIEDTSHAAVVVSFLVRSQNRGYSDLKEMMALTKTFHEVYNGTNSVNRVRSHLSSTYGSVGEEKWAKALGAWYELIPYDATLYPKIKNIQDRWGSRLTTKAALRRFKP